MDGLLIFFAMLLLRQEALKQKLQESFAILARCLRDEFEITSYHFRSVLRHLKKAQRLYVESHIVSRTFLVFLFSMLKHVLRLVFLYKLFFFSSPYFLQIQFRLVLFLIGAYQTTLPYSILMRSHVTSLNAIWLIMLGWTISMAVMQPINTSDLNGDSSNEDLILPSADLMLMNLLQPTVNEDIAYPASAAPVNDWIDSNSSPWFLMKSQQVLYTTSLC